MVGRDGLHREVLLDCFSQAGAEAPRSYITTGNVTFTAPPDGIGAIRDRVEAAIEEVVGRRTEVYVRSVPYLQDLIAREPYRSSPVADAVDHEVMFLYEDIDPSELELPIVSSGGHIIVFGATSTEVFAAGREIDGQRKGAGGWVQRLLGQRVTARAWRTIERVVADPV